VGSRDPDRARQVASATGATRGATYAEAAADAEVVILTVPWPAIDDVLGQLGALNQTVVVDVSWPARKSEREALAGSSTAEQIQRRLPSARKATRELERLVGIMLFVRLGPLRVLSRG
jgi:8-hydroxy-5-deazaflavin:NADPH oxidoreductase